MNTWILVHRFRRLSADGKVQPITCPDCNNEVVYLPDEEDEPFMYCGACNNSMYPGILFWAEMKSVVSEHYLD